MNAAGASAPERWCAGLNRWPRLGLAALAGAVMTGGHPPVGLPWGFFVAVPFLVWLIQAAPSARAAAWTGWAAGAGYFITGMHWVGNAFLVDPDKFLLLMPLGVIGLPSGLAIFWALAFWAAKRMWLPGWQGALVLAATLSAVELARGYVLTGLPWALPAYIWLDTPLMQAASWAGPFGLTFVTLLLTAVPLVAFVRREYLVLGAAAGALAALWAAGMQRVPDDVAYADDAPLLRLVQPNAPQRLKWEPGYREDFYRRQLDATMESPAGDGRKPDLILWPEVAVHFIPAENPQEIERIAEAADGTPVILGAFHRENADGQERVTNAMQTVMPDGTLGPIYHKHHLVPFGEYMPLVWILGELGLPDFSEGIGLSSGDGPKTLRLPGLPPFSPNICYESIFPYEVVGAERPGWIAQITNDAWFGSFAGPQQHLAQARFRAVEQGLPVVRATNTGISAVIDPFGRETARIGLDKYAWIDAELPSALEVTLYSNVGDISFTLMLAVLMAVLLFKKFRRS